MARIQAVLPHSRHFIMSYNDGIIILFNIVNFVLQSISVSSNKKWIEAYSLSEFEITTPKINEKRTMY